MEQLAFSYLVLDRSPQEVISLLVMLIGGGAYYLASPSVPPRGQVRYFVGLCCVFTPFILIGCVMWLLPRVIEADRLGVLVALLFASYLLLGVLLGYR